MKFEFPEDPALREVRKLIEQQERLFGSSSLKDILDASKTPAERLGLNEAAWEQVQREMKVRDELEAAERHGLPKSVWDHLQQEKKLQDQVDNGLALGGVAEYLDKQSRDSLAAMPDIGATMRESALPRPYQPELEYTPPPMPDFNAGPRLLKQQD